MTPDEHSQADIRFHAQIAHVYEQELEPLFAVYSKGVNERFSALVQAAPGRRALDVGCGTGVVTVALAERGFQVTGLDHSEAMMAMALKKATEHGVADQIELKQGDVRALPFEDSSFDLVTCQGVLHHLEELQGCVGEIYRVLAPGGVFYIAEPCEGAPPTLRAWNGTARIVGAGRRFLSRKPPATVPVSPVTDAESLAHDEESIDARELLTVLEALGFEYDVRYWTLFPGLYRFPLPLQAAAIAVLSRPWMRRSGNMIAVSGRRS